MINITYPFIVKNIIDQRSVYKAGILLKFNTHHSINAKLKVINALMHSDQRGVYKPKSGEFKIEK